jgi:hypothetical protein
MENKKTHPKGGGQHSLAGEGAGGANWDDWGESLALWFSSTRAKTIFKHVFAPEVS